MLFVLITTCKRWGIELTKLAATPEQISNYAAWRALSGLHGLKFFFTNFHFQQTPWIFDNVHIGRLGRS